jgi:hypothetical protein
MRARASRDRPGILDINEMTASVEGQYNHMYRAAREWDRKHPVHGLEPRQPA